MGSGSRLRNRAAAAGLLRSRFAGVGVADTDGNTSIRPNRTRSCQPRLKPQRGARTSFLAYWNQARRTMAPLTPFLLVLRGWQLLPIRDRPIRRRRAATTECSAG